MHDGDVKTESEPCHTQLWSALEQFDDAVEKMRHLYNTLAGEARHEDTKPERLRDMRLDLIDNTHRLRDLIGEMVAFRSSKEHDKMMAKLDAILTKAGTPEKVGA